MRRRTLIALALTVAAWLPCQAARADVKLPALFSDGMVLQRDMSCPIWGTAAPGEKVSVELSRGDRAAIGTATADQDGKWLLRLPRMQAGGPYPLIVIGKNKITLKDVYVGEVWVCSGQSNMEMSLAGTENAKEVIAKSSNPQLRLFTVKRATSDKPLTDVTGKWSDCNPETVKRFSAVAYFFGRDLNKALNVPVGLIHTSWGGTRAEAWTSRPVLESHEEWKGEFSKPARAGNPNAPSVLYNAMIAPLIPYAIKGAIWYQGESNAGKAYQYRKLFPTMIQNWRDDWKQGDFPFLFVQLAPWRAIVTEPQESDWAELREAQLLTARKLKNTGMAVITDVGDPKDIHPKKKEPVGARLALAALALAYGEKIEYSGPIYDKMTVQGDKAVLRFTHAGKGLEAKDGELKGFTIAGADRTFHNARAEIKGDTVVVWSDRVKEPAAVRYGWADCPVVNLWNKDGLPASPFRTDDFPRKPRPKPAKKP